MALNDALACGIPVITTDAGGIPYSVPHDMGVFVQTGNVNSLKKAISSVLRDKIKYSELYTSASEYHKTATSWQKSVEEYHKLISALT
jgi:glycosyltransferase involved in cell wall biosynthesis